MIEVFELARVLAHHGHLFFDVPRVQRLEEIDEGIVENHCGRLDREVGIFALADEAGLSELPGVQRADHGRHATARRAASHCDPLSVDAELSITGLEPAHSADSVLNRNVRQGVVEIGDAVLRAGTHHAALREVVTLP